MSYIVETYGFFCAVLGDVVLIKNAGLYIFLGWSRITRSSSNFRSAQDTPVLLLSATLVQGLLYVEIIGWTNEDINDEKTHQFWPSSTLRPRPRKTMTKFTLQLLKLCRCPSHRSPTKIKRLWDPSPIPERQWGIQQKGRTTREMAT